VAERHLYVLCADKWISYDYPSAYALHAYPFIDLDFPDTRPPFLYAASRHIIGSLQNACLSFPNIGLKNGQNPISKGADGLSLSDVVMRQPTVLQHLKIAIFGSLTADGPLDKAIPYCLFGVKP